MKQSFSLIIVLACLVPGPGLPWQACANELEQEYVTTSPVVEDGVLYVASSTYPGGRGHLRAIDILDTIAVTLWDAADRVPLAGEGYEQPEVIQRDNQTRSLFTNHADGMISLAASSAIILQSSMGATSLAEAESLLHATRGRRGGSEVRPAGVTEDSQRLWSISRSSPVLVGRSLYDPAAESRDRVLYVGADDGMLHAFFASRWNVESGNYLIDDPDGGVELWAYLPGSFLPDLKEQPFDDAMGEPVIRLDGSPLAREFFLDLDGDGLRRWHTLLVATGTIAHDRRSSLFVLDITDPYQPALLWEKLLPGNGTGRTRGINVGRCGASSADCIYLAADFVTQDEAGIHALAVSIAEGELLWQFTFSYAARGPVASATPAVPVLADLDGDDASDSLIFGDLVGQLWALDLATGAARGNAPVFVAPGGEAEPIGAGVAAHKNLVVFGTGGVEEADSNYQYSLYAVEVLPGATRLRWTYPLALGEKVWQAPTLDQHGNLVFATSMDYLSLTHTTEQSTSGRVVTLDRSGEEATISETEAATIGRVVATPGLIVSVDLTGEVTQFGEASRLLGPSGNLGSVKVLSWRQR